MKEDYQISNLIILYKFLLGLVEFLTGVAIIIWGRPAVEMYQNFKRQELLEDPHDFLVRILQTTVPYVLAHRGYVVIVLLLLGLAKMVGAMGLKYNKAWGVDILVGLTLVLLPFQLLNLLRQPSWFGLGYIIVGLLITMYLINFKPKEYVRKFKKRIVKDSDVVNSR